MRTTKYYVFNLFFNYDKQEKAKAEATREETLTYLTQLLANKARFACVAKAESKDKPCLMLRGYVNLRSPCTQPHLKGLLGKYCTCYPSDFGDVMNLCRLVCVDKQLVTVGRMARVGGHSNVKSFTSNPKFVVKILVDSIHGNN